MNEEKRYKIYKGLQRPLIFKIFKGKYIYWAGGSMVVGVIGAGIASTLFGSLTGIITLIGITIPLLLYTVNKQKSGIYSKTRNNKIYVIQQKYSLKK